MCKGTRIRFPKGLPRSIIQKTAPREYVQHARNPARNVTIGGNNTVFAPVYGPPFIRNLDEGRRYATIEDFRNFVKLAYMSPSIHHSGGTVCEPVDLPVNKRHLDMVYSHIRYSDKPFMGSVTQPERAAGHGGAWRRSCSAPSSCEQNTVITSLINANSPMVWDGTMLGALKVYARDQPGLHHHAVHPVGRDEPGDGGGHARAGAGGSAVGRRRPRSSYRPGAPVMFGVFASSISMQSGAPTFGTPEPTLVSFAARAAGAAARHSVPHRRLALRLEDGRRAGGL